MQVLQFQLFKNFTEKRLSVLLRQHLNRIANRTIIEQVRSFGKDLRASLVFVMCW